MAIENPLSSSKTNTKTITKAVSALLKWHKSNSKLQKYQLSDQDDFLYLILTLNKIPPKGRFTEPYKIPLPNPLHPFDSSDLCLIFHDRPKSKLTSESINKKLQSLAIPISKVLKFSKLKSDYTSFEAKQKLCGEYDLFFADKRVIPLLPRQLEKEFGKKKKVPIPVDLMQKNWKEEFELSCRSELLFLRSGTCCVIKVGRISQSRDEIVANVVAAIDGVAQVVPRKWGNIRSFHLKLTESLALPIYQTVPDVGLAIEGGGKQEEEKKVDSQVKVSHEVRYVGNEEIMDDMFGEQDDDDDESNVMIVKNLKKAEELKKLKQPQKAKKEEGRRKGAVLQ